MPNKRALLLHGFMSDEHSYFLPNLKQRLRDKGFDVKLKSLPNPDNPDLASWEHSILCDLQDTYFDRVIAHSLGGVLALQLLSQHKIKTHHLTMIATSVGLESVTKLGAFLSPPLCLKSITESANQIYAIHSIDDPWSNYEHAILFTKQWPCCT